MDPALPHIIEARRLLHERKYGSAMTDASDALRIDPDNAEAQALLSSAGQKVYGQRGVQVGGIGCALIAILILVGLPFLLRWPTYGPQLPSTLDACYAMGSGGDAAGCGFGFQRFMELDKTYGPVTSHKLVSVSGGYFLTPYTINVNTVRGNIPYLETLTATTISRSTGVSRSARLLHGSHGFQFDFRSISIVPRPSGHS